MSAPEPTATSAARDAAFDAEALATFFSRSMEEVVADLRLPAALDAAIAGLERGAIRAAVPVSADGGWRAVPWVKTAILAGFRSTPIVEMAGGAAPAFDRAAFPARTFAEADGIRIVPGGSAIRRGAHLAPGVVLMPPSYVNVGAWVGEGTMIDSHVLVGSCAQIGAHVHLSAGVQIGGVLEPPGALPVVVEEGAFVGAQSGVFEGVLVGGRAVLAPGVHLTASTLIYDLVEQTTWRGQIPADAVVVPGTRRASGAFADAHGLSLFAPVIVKYRDASTDAATALEQALR